MSSESDDDQSPENDPLDETSASDDGQSSDEDDELSDEEEKPRTTKSRRPQRKRSQQTRKTTKTKKGKKGKKGALIRLRAPLPFINLGADEDEGRPAEQERENEDTPFLVPPIVTLRTRIDPNLSRFHSVVVNVLGILEARGYLIPQNLKQIANVDDQQFVDGYQQTIARYNDRDEERRSECRPQLDIYWALSGVFRQQLPPNGKEVPFVERDDPYPAEDAIDGSLSEGILVYFVSPPEPGKKQTSTDCIKFVTEYLDTYGKANVKKALIVAWLPLGSEARKLLETRRRYKVEFFLMEELTYRPSQNFLNPQFQKLTKQEIETEILVATKSLETIAHNDPIVREFGWQIGDILRITRRNDNWSLASYENVTYRRVAPINVIPTKSK